MMRDVAPADAPALADLLGRCELFRPDEMDAVAAMLDDYHATGVAAGRRMRVWEQDGRMLGVVYEAPKEFTDRVWELLMIAVDAEYHRRGIGSRMLQDVESRLRDAGARLLLIETSDKDEFERTRQFYRKHAYTEAARIPDFFADGDGKASFVKRL